ncbi:MAG: L,D-transpeptidase family protein [Segniliparus sp.]|uniref:L,D-transpeptidase family protein n=1 Tax=Segniliparus sp. TaxID=2804064 RepID=UPI003F2AE9FD
MTIGNFEAEVAGATGRPKRRRQARRLLRAAVAVAAVLAPLPLVQLSPAPSAPAAPALAATPPWFSGQVGGASQVVAVTGDQSGRANVEVWGKFPGADGAGQWWSMTGPLSGFVGSAGIADQSKDGYPATPAGVFSLPWAFGTDPAPQTGLPFHHTGPNDWWVGDMKSPLYNSFSTCAPGSCPFNEKESERLAIPEYALAVVMGVNAERKPGAGGAFFLHVQGGGPTAGCVSMDKTALRNLITWLKPGAVIAVRRA